MKYDLFLDESCHLENDKSPVMCIGYTKIPHMAYGGLKSCFIEVKRKHHAFEELKWNKFSKSRLPFYKDVVDFFFDNPIDFRCILVKYKERLNHEDFNSGDHNNFYYKMIFYLLKPNTQEGEYRVFLDIMNTRGKQRLVKINEVFDNFYHGHSPFTHFQHLHSHDNEFFQITDLFIGAIAYKCRLLHSNPDVQKNEHKMEFIEYLEKKAGFNLHAGISPWETKFNIFNHQPRQR